MFYIMRNCIINSSKAQRGLEPLRPVGLRALLLPKRGTYPSPNLSPHGERLKKFFAETDEKF